MQTDFQVVHQGTYTQTELDNMLPWEREVNLSLLQQQLKKELEEYESRKAN